jgi:hypothetical protein
MPDFHIIDTHGQSLSSGGEGTPILNATAISKAWMVGASVGGGTGADREGNFPLVGTETVQALKMVDQESIHAGFAKWLFQYGAQPATTEYGFTYSGISGQDLQDMIKGTVPHAKRLAMITKMRDYAVARGFTVKVTACLVITGENRSAFWLNTNNPDNYRALWLKHYDDLNADIKAITGQSEDVRVILDQTSSAGFYHVFLVKNNQTSAPPYPTAALVHSQLAQDYPTKFSCVGPKFQWSYQHTYGQNSVHLNSSGYEGLGEKFAQVYNKVITQGASWKPLQMRRARFYTSSTIVVDFDIPVAPLQWDATILNEGSRGFEYSDDSGAPPAITSVQIIGLQRNQIEIVLANPPTGANPVVRLAWLNWDHQALTDPLPASPPYPRAMGKKYGARSQLIDSDTAISLQGYDLLNHALHGQVPVEQPIIIGVKTMGYGVEPNDISQYSNGLDQEVWIHPTPLSAVYQKPVTRAMSVGNSGAGAWAGVTSLLLASGIAVTPLPSRIPNGMRFKSTDNQVFVADASALALDPITGTRFAPTGSSTLTVKPLIRPVQYGLVAPNWTDIVYTDYLQMYSVESGDLDNTASAISYRNIQAGAYKVQAKQSIEGKLNLKGYTTRTDTMMRLLRQIANRTDQWVYIRLIFPDNECVEAPYHVLGTKRSFKVDDPYMCDFNFVMAGDPVIYDLTPG